MKKLLLLLFVGFTLTSCVERHALTKDQMDAKKIPSHVYAYMTQPDSLIKDTAIYSDGEKGVDYFFIKNKKITEIHEVSGIDPILLFVLFCLMLLVGVMVGAMRN